MAPGEALRAGDSAAVAAADSPALGEYLPSPSRPHRGPPPLSRLRYQVPIVVAAAAVLPAALLGEPHFLEPARMSSSSNTFIAIAASALLALLLFRRLGTFPGITSFGQVIPSIVVPYLGALATLLMLRLEYSRPLFALGLVAACLLYVALWVYYRRHCAPTLFLLPGAALDVGARANVLPLAQPRAEFGSNSVIAADLDAQLTPRWEKFLLNSVLAGVPVYDVRQLQESITGKVEVAHLSENTFGSVMPNIAYLKLKRAVDLIAALMALPAVLPAMLIIALLIKLDSPGRVFFVQERMGFRGRPFRMVKFRTMTENSGFTAGLDNRDAAKTGDQDVRVTRIGRFLRRSRLDELPQILNIMRGEMSWIGPRPEAVSLSAWYHAEIPFYGYRHIVRPGITGWAQVNQGHVVEVGDVKEKLFYDFYYIKYFSAWLDALIALRTVKILVVGTGAK